MPKSLAQQIEDDKTAAIQKFSTKLRAEMKKRGVTHHMVAVQLGTADNNVTQLLRGSNFTFGTAAALARAVGCCFTVLLAK